MKNLLNNFSSCSYKENIRRCLVAVCFLVLLLIFCYYGIGSTKEIKSLDTKLNRISSRPVAGIALETNDLMERVLDRSLIKIGSNIRTTVKSGEIDDLITNPFKESPEIEFVIKEEEPIIEEEQKPIKEEKKEPIVQDTIQDTIIEKSTLTSYEEEIIEASNTRENTLYYVIDEEKNFYLKEEYQNFLWNKLKEYNRTDLYELCIAMMYHESQFRVNAISATHDHGLMQINESNFGWLRSELGVGSIDDPYNNITCGVYMLMKHLREVGNIEAALVYYNRGRANSSSSTEYSRCILYHDMNCLRVLENQRKDV